MQTMIKTTLALLSLVSAAAAQAPRGPEGRLPALPAAITSFGAAVSDGKLYVYGGHIGRAHDHSRENFADGFWRIDLARPEAWESLPKSEKVQGLSMVAWKGSVIRIGGVTAHNAPDQPSDMHSTASVERFDAKQNKWVALTPLPEPRSSLDAVVFNDKLYVIGGWQLKGDNKSAVWADKNYVADLTAEPLVWKPLPAAEFRQRALAVAATSKRIYAIGGMTPEGESTQAVQIFDPATETWSKGPDLPATGELKAFGASAWGSGDTIWASSADGKVQALNEGAANWRDAQVTLASPRFFHRILPNSRGALMFIGGAMKGKHLDNIETVDLSLLKAKPTAALPAAEGNSTVANGQANWPGFRGQGDNHSGARDLPLRWSDSENIAWSTALPGYGQSSPVVWGGLAFITSMEGAAKEQLHVSCFDVRDGEKRWQKTFAPSQTWVVSEMVSKASPTPCVDAQRLYVFFETGDVLAFSHDGELAWQRSLVKDYGEFKGNHGVGTSLVQDDTSLYLAIDHDGPSYLLALDKATGANRWKTDHAQRVAWSTPLLSRGRLIVSASGVAEAYDAATGKALWSIGGFAGNNVPSPTETGDLVVIGSTDRENNLALTADGRIAWRAAESTSGFSSPLAVGDRVYFVNKAGVAFSHEAKTGALRWSLRLPESCWATPIANGDNLYFFTKGGATVVLRDTANGPQRVAESKLTITGRVYGVAAVDGAFLVRTGDRLICLKQS